MYDVSLKRKWDNKAVLDYAEQKGIEKGKQEVVENLIAKLGLSDEQIMDIAEVSLDFVQKIRTSLSKKK